MAAAVDAGTGAADLHQAGDQARRTALHDLARLLVADGALDAARVDQAVDEAWLVTGADVYVRATRGNGWSDDDYEDWLGSLLADHMVSGSDDHVES